MGRPENLFAELGRWRDKATKRGKVTNFNSDIIPDWLSAEIVAAQEAVGPEAAFSFLKQTPLDVRMAAERRIRREVETILNKHLTRAARAIHRGEPFDYEGLADELRAAVMPEMSALMLDNTLRLSVDTGITFDPAIINTEALRWAREFSTRWAQGLNATTRSQLQEAIAAFVQTPGLTIGNIEELITPAFGAARAEMIAITEVTRAYSVATNRLTEMLRQQTPELTITKVWNTMNDELVCAICGPAEGAPENEWTGLGLSADGPPAHPNCRCGTSIRFETPEQLGGEFEQRQREREAWLREQGLLPAAAPVPIEYQGWAHTDEAHEWMSANFSDWRKTISRDEERAFYGYVRQIDEDYYKMNSYLRGQLDTEDAKQVAARLTGPMDAAIGRGTLGGDVTLWRGANQTGLFADPASLVGQVIQDDGYISTTVTADKAGRWAGAAERANEAPLLCEIRTPAGTHAAYMEDLILDQTGERVREYETILPRGTKFRVVSFRSTQTFEFLISAQERYPLLVLEVVP